MASQVSGFRLVVYQGPDAGQTFPLEQDQIDIGRDPACELSFSVPLLSNRHARLTRRGDTYLLADLNSTNGTSLNGTPVSGPVILQAGDQILLAGQLGLTFYPPEEETFVRRQVRSEQATRVKAAGRAPALAQLLVQIGDQAPVVYPLSGETVRLGRAEENEIVIPSPTISRRHARLDRARDGYLLTVAAGATNPLLIGEQRLTEPHLLRPGDVIRIPGPDPKLAVTLTYQVGQPAAVQDQPPAPAHRDQPETRPEARPPVAQQPLAPPPAAETRLERRARDETVIESDRAAPPPPLPAGPAQLQVTIAGQEPQTYWLEKERLTLGRAEDNDIVISSPVISRYHAVLERQVHGYELVVLPQALNAFYCDGRFVRDRLALQHGAVLRVDSDMPGTMVTLVYHVPAEATAYRAYRPIIFGEKTNLTFGRDAQNDVVLDQPTVSRYHAELERVGRRYRLRDLRSANGTFVNDERVEGELWLQPDDTVRIGNYRFVVAEDQLNQYDESGGLQVEAYGLNKWVRKNLNILEDISLIFQPREFVVVVGQSGGGKSTLVDAIAGYRPATHGRVFVNGVDIYQNFDAIRNEIGYVPQKDIIHMELTVYQALEYAARLRMPRDTSKQERQTRILEVLEDLDLLHRKDAPINSLSGGQQKRVSIGVELLTKPGLFFLDEPTSGLDPGTETAFMRLMRRLADQGRTIILVTHATKNVMLADKVVFLARGGYLAWFGPPEEALRFFDQYRSERDRRAQEMEFDQIYAILDDPSKGSAKEWAERFQASQAYQDYIVAPLQNRTEELALAQQAEPPRRRRARRARRVSGLHQFRVLSGRNMKILTRDRSSLILMLLAAPLVAMLDLLIAPLMGAAPFDYVQGDAANGPVTLFLMTIYCLLVAGLSQMREFVKEADIYKRERLVNLKILPYVISKVWVALLLAFYHALAYTAIHYLAFEMPGGMQEFLLVYVTMVLAAMAGMLGGLLVSALAPAASSAPLIMILLIVPQIVLSGALAPVPETASAAASTRWAFEALIGITGMGSDVAADPCWQLDEDLRAAMTLDDKGANGCRCMGVAMFDPDTCHFPGIGQYYEPEIDQPKPLAPAELRQRPPEPVIPLAPEPPEDAYDQVAVAQYLNTLQDYQDQVQLIQDLYRAEVDLYQAEADVYQADYYAYQEALAKWNIARNSAVGGAEGLIDSVRSEFGWAWVDKDSPELFWSWMISVWAGQAAIMGVYLVLILVLVKRKDVN